MKKISSSRGFKLIRNLLLIIAALIILWLVMGTPALTRNQAFRRAMREHFMTPKAPEVCFGEDGFISALAEVEGPAGNVYVQTRLRKSGLIWDYGLWLETQMINAPALAGYYSGDPGNKGVGSAYIIPLFAYGTMTDSPEVAVLQRNVDAKQIHTSRLIFIFEGESHQLDFVGEQDGWLLFRFGKDVWKDPETEYKRFIKNHEYMKLGTPEGRTGCSFIFSGYDQNGNPLIYVGKDY